MVSALEALRSEESKIGISTNCARIDQDLFGNGGIPLGAVTEICGMAGMGKTQLCMQLCSSVHLPGVDGCAIFIDCEGSFIASRMKQIALATVAQSHNAISLESILENTTIVRLRNQEELIEYIKNLESVIQQNLQVKLIVIDSIAFFFRSFSGDYAERTRILWSITQKLRQMAQIYNIAVVVTNQMTTKIKSGAAINGTLMVPALGESWGHCCTHRVILMWYNNCRSAWLCKSSTRNDCLVPFSISSQGITDHFEA